MVDENRIHPPKGMRDWSPREVRLRQQLMDVIARTYRLYGYSPVDTPALENLEVLLGKGGGENEKLLFKVLKRGGDLQRAQAGDLADLGLRFDLTVPLARYVAVHLNDLPKVFRCYRMAPVWRADKPQRGRFREFYQCDIDVVGADSDAYEVEILTASERTLNALGLGEVRLRLSDKRLLTHVLRALGVEGEKTAGVCICLDKLDKKPIEDVMQEVRDLMGDSDSFHKLRDWVAEMKGGEAERLVPAEFLQFLHSQDMELKGILDHLWSIVETCRQINPKSRVEFDPLLVRGMDYYTGPVFEAGIEGVPFSLGGGGRYDGLIGLFAGRAIPAVGFSIGFERILTLLMEASGEASGDRHKVFLARTGQGDAEIHRMAEWLRCEGIPVEASYLKEGLGQQMKAAEASGAGYAVRGFDSERKVLMVRRLSDRQDTEMTLEQLRKALGLPGSGPS
jgi:histidyl-tRNA synthetase